MTLASSFRMVWTKCNWKVSEMEVKLKVKPTVVEIVLSKGFAIKDNSEIRQQLVGNVGSRKMF